MQESFMSKLQKEFLQVFTITNIFKVTLPVLLGPLILVVYCLRTGVPYAEFVSEFGHVLFLVSGIIWVFLLAFALYVCAPSLILASLRIDTWFKLAQTDALLRTGIDKETARQICPGFFIGLLLIALLILLSGQFTAFIWYFISFIVTLLFFLLSTYVPAVRKRIVDSLECSKAHISTISTNFFMVLYTIFLVYIVNGYVEQIAGKQELPFLDDEYAAIILVPLLSFFILMIATFGLSKLKAINSVISLAIILILVIFVYPGPFKLIDNVFRWFRIGGGLPVILYVEPMTACVLPDRLKESIKCKMTERSSLALEMVPMALVFAFNDRFYLRGDQEELRSGGPTLILRREDVRVVEYLDKTS